MNYLSSPPQDHGRRRLKPSSIIIGGRAPTRLLIDTVRWHALYIIRPREHRLPTPAGLFSPTSLLAYFIAISWWGSYTNPDHLRILLPSRLCGHPQYINSCNRREINCKPRVKRLSKPSSLIETSCTLIFLSPVYLVRWTIYKVLLFFFSSIKWSDLYANRQCRILGDEC